MKSVKNGSRKPGRKGIAILLTVAVLLSMCAVAFMVTASAGTPLSGTMYLDVSENPDWQGKLIVASFDGSESTAAFYDGGDGLTAEVPDDIGESEMMTLTVYPADYPIDLAGSGENRIVWNAELGEFIYAWNVVDDEIVENAQFPGETGDIDETGDTDEAGETEEAAGGYYFKDYENEFENVIFSGGDSVGKTSDLVPVYFNGTAYYDGNEFAEPIVSSVSVLSSDCGEDTRFAVDLYGSVSIVPNEDKGGEPIAAEAESEEVSDTTSRIPHNFGSGIYAATATYFDYMSDQEITSGYLNRSSTRNDDPFKNYLNKAISDYSRTNGISRPLYFGNLYNIHDGGYNGYYNYYYAPNNSNGLGKFWYAVQGLASASLVNNQIYAPNSSSGAAMPIFDRSWLSGDNSTGKQLAMVYDSYFPFVESKNGDVTTYTFDSSGGGVRDTSSGAVISQNKGASDNVYFKWNGKTPTQVSYGKGTNYAVGDGGKQGNNEFYMDGCTGFGIFPFDNTATSGSGNTSATNSVGSVSVPSNEIWIDSKNGDTVAVYAWTGGSNTGTPQAIAKNEYGYFAVKAPYTNYTNFLLTSQAGNWDANKADNLSMSAFKGKLCTYSGSSLTEGVSKPSNSYNDYGFGIRLDMDFRVPAGGVLPSSTVDVPSNEVWVSSTYGQVGCHAWNGNGGSGNETGLQALSKNQYGYYVISAPFTNYTSFLLTSNPSSFDNSNKTADMTLSGYKGRICTYSGSSLTATSQTSVTTGETPVTFDYSGDDDLWVYISDNTGKNELVLDLGGDHKFTKGSINFKTMKATAETVNNNYNTQTVESVKVPSDEFWIASKSYEGTNYGQLYVKTWDKKDKWGNTVDTYYAPYATITYTFSDGTTEKFFKYKMSYLGSSTQFTVNSDNYGGTASELCTLNVAGDLVAGNAFTVRDRSSTGATLLAQTYSHVNNKGGFTQGSSVSNSFFGGQQLDPAKTYHMTVFYMERGLIESNLSVSFTMTPVKNNLLVDKVVEIPNNINSDEIADAIYNNDTFGYNASNNGTAITGKKYTYTTQGGSSNLISAGNGGSFSLKDTESAYFASQFETGSSMTVTEGSVDNLPSTVSLSDRYSTKWNLYNNGTQIANSPGTTANFNLGSTTDQQNAELELTYTNTLKLGDLALYKTVSNDASSTRDFTFNVKLDVNGGTSVSNTSHFATYPIWYKLYNNSGSFEWKYSNSGTVTFNPQQHVVIDGLPAGATYYVTESVPSGYSVNSPYWSGKINASGTASVNAVNTQSDGSGTIELEKYVEGEAYTGRQFSFTMTALDYDGFLKITPETITTNTVINGKIHFTVTFSSTGKYRCKIVENDFDTTNLPGYQKDNKEIYVQFEVVSGDSGFIINNNSIKFYKNAEFGATTTAAFYNNIPPAKITINKFVKTGEDTQNPLPDVQFALIKVKSETALSETQINEIISSQTTNMHKGTTNNSGTILFDKLPLYQNGDKIYDQATSRWVDGANYINGTSVRQTYLVFEYSAANGYNTTYTTKYVTFPYEGQNEITFDYENVAVVTPHTSGSGMKLFTVVGLGVLGTGALASAAYFMLRRRKRVTSRHSRHGR